jgi:hypothetical protein
MHRLSCIPSVALGADGTTPIREEVAVCRAFPDAPGRIRTCDPRIRRRQGEVLICRGKVASTALAHQSAHQRPRGLPLLRRVLSAVSSPATRSRIAESLAASLAFFFIHSSRDDYLRSLLDDLVGGSLRSVSGEIGSVREDRVAFS